MRVGGRAGSTAPDRGAPRALLVRLGDGAQEGAPDRDVRRDLAPGDEPDLRDDPLVARARHREVDAPAVLGQGQDEIPLGDRARDEVEQVEREGGPREIDAGDAVLLGEHRGELALLEAEREEARADGSPRARDSRCAASTSSVLARPRATISSPVLGGTPSPASVRAPQSRATGAERSPTSQRPVACEGGHATPRCPRTSSRGT